MEVILQPQNGKEEHTMNKLRMACADFTFPLLPHDKVLDLIALLDCDGIDIGLFNGRSHLRPDTQFENITANAKILKNKLNDRGLEASDVYLQLDADLAGKAINHPDQQTRFIARDQFLKLLEYAGELGADHITCLPGMYFTGQDNKKSLDLIYEELSWRVQETKKTNLVFAVEAHVGSPFIEPVSAKRLVEAVKGLTLTLDYTHFIKEGYLQEEVDPLIEHASHFHARGAKKGRLQTSMTQNTIDYSSIIQKLFKNNYEGCVGLEYIWIDWEQCNDVDNISETLRLMDIIKKAYSAI